MSQFVVEMTGDEAKLFKAFQKIVDQQKKVDEGNKKLERSSNKAATASKKIGDEGVKSSDKMSAGLVRVQGALAGAVGGVMSISFAMNLVRGQWQRDIDQMEKAVDGLRKKLATASDIGQGKVVDGKPLSMIRKNLIGSVDTPYTSEQRNLELGKIAFDTQDNATDEEVVGAIKAISDLTGFLNDSQQNTVMKNTFGLNQIAGDMPEEDVRDAALFAMQNGVNDISPFMQSIQASSLNMDFDDQMEMMIAAGRSDQGTPVYYGR